LQSFHEVDPDKFQVASLDSCNHRFCLKCIQCWAKIKTSCPTCRTAFKYVDSSTGKRFECKAEVPTPSASDSDPEETISDNDADILGVDENSDQYLSDDGFVVNDNVIQYDTDFESNGLQDDECFEELVDLRVEVYSSNSIDDDEPEGVKNTRLPRRVHAPHFKSAIERFEEMRWKRRKIESSIDTSHTHGSKYFQSHKNDRLSAAVERPESRRRRRIQQAGSASDSDDAHTASQSGSRSTAAVAGGAQLGQGGWLSRLKTHVKTPAALQASPRNS
jgi:hypothetical protein